MNGIELYRFFQICNGKVNRRLVLSYQAKWYKRMFSLYEYEKELWRNKAGTIFLVRIEGGIEDAYVGDDYLDYLHDADSHLVHWEAVKHGDR